MSEHIININGVLYVSRINEFGIYMVRVNPDGTDWVSSPQYTAAEIATGITVGPSNIQIATQEEVAAKRPNIFRRVKRKLFG